MGENITVATSASEVGISGMGVLAAVGVAVAGGLYMAGFNAKNISYAAVGLSMVILAIVLWILLTDVAKLGKLITDNQLVALVLTCVLGAGVAQHGALAFKMPNDATR